MGNGHIEMHNDCKEMQKPTQHRDPKITANMQKDHIEMTTKRTKTTSLETTPNFPDFMFHLLRKLGLVSLPFKPISRNSAPAKPITEESHRSLF